MSGNITLITKYFPQLTSLQIERFGALNELYAHWNAQINVISRKDMEGLYEKHILHSLGIAKILRFTEGSHILDVGTGGGFPGIPLAIMFPEVRFHLVDSIGKKIKVVSDISDKLQLHNVNATHTRAETLTGHYDFVVSRAVTELPTFTGWISRNISKQHQNALPNGVLYLKGGDLSRELKPFGKRAVVYELSEHFDGEFFETKKVVYLAI